MDTIQPRFTARATAAGDRNGHTEASDGSVGVDLSVPTAMGGPTATCDVSIGPREGGGFGLAVKIHVEDKSLPQAELATLATEAHEEICPYSHATRGNVYVDLEVFGA